ncbi:MAG: mechanosensitive ion channel [Desulfobacterales bacterium]|jgi:small-conductance mechanosensitive channel
MRYPAKTILRVVFPIVVFLISSPLLAQEQPEGDQAPGAKQEVTASAPDLADIIPKAAQLSGDLAALENRVAGAMDISEFEKKIARIEKNLEGPAAELKQIKDSKAGKLNKFFEIRKIIERESELFEDINKPLKEAIRQFGAWRNDWQAEKQHWERWQSALLEDGDLAQLNSTFAKAKDTIDKALEIVNSQLDSVLRVQSRAGAIQAKILVLSAELDALISAARSGIRVNISPPMFSSQYFSQYSSELWYALLKGVVETPWISTRILDRQGWIVFMQVFFSVFVILSIYRNRQLISNSQRWRFLAARPFAAGIFFGTIVFMSFYEYRGLQDTWGLYLSIVGGISFARLNSALNPASWKRQFVYGVIIVYIVTRLLQVVMLPLPLMRLFTVLAALAGLLFCWRLAVATIRQKDSGIYRWTLRLGACFLAFVILAEIWGKQGLAEFLFISLLRSTTPVLAFMLFMYIIRGFIEWIFRSSSFQQMTLFYGDTDVIVRRVTLFINAAICGLILLPGMLFSWGVYDDLSAAIKGLLSLGFNVGSQRISLGLVIIAAGILYGSFFASWIIQKLLTDQVLARRRVEVGVQVAIAKLVHYVLIFIGFVVALLALGFEFTKLTIMLSALGVGIGFGLQGIVNNFVSGLILLFERPVRVGDYIEFGGNWAEIKKIGLRATTVQTFDEADVIIPNADLVSNQVINWTLTNRRVRLIIPVGVAYGSDISLVMETLVESAKQNSDVAEEPIPQVLFLNFGESSLEFELRVWVLDADNRLVVSSAIHQEIDRRFREAKIEIAFPQRDLHLRSLDESTNLQPPEISR